MEQRTFLAARADRWARERPLRLDLALTGLTWVVCGPASALVAGATGLTVATAGIVALVFRRRFPALVLGWSAAAFAVQLLVVPIPLPGNAAQAIVVYTVAARVASLGVRLLALGCAVAGSLAGGFRWSTPPQYARNALVIGVTLAVCSVLIWVIGELVRGGRANTRALYEARIRLEENRLQEERLAAQRRRMVAAAEIHDIVAHSLTVVIVQADAGEYAAGHAPAWERADAGAVLATVAGTARTALAEVRGVIEMLHQPESAGEPPGAAVNLEDVRRLIESVRAAGLPVQVTGIDAWFDEMPAAVRLAVFRAIREALTNVLKHAGAGANAWLTVERGGDAVRVRVEDDGPGPPTPAPSAAKSGHGLNGLRERLSEVDGVLTAGPRPGHGFLVEVTIPVGGR
ncbi:histidine kinase [Actinoplanes sp. NEAU-A12]|uniref:histidine kinase n=1 Tax=Actinoplanes sandaracinus TaxID=3045177 RepID=A0ABT6WBD0_9ACTN|nr:ATP-binding protein [Actinoplanes sandaracinus]MDI6097028.1 histidine kinase [Actinoplanes sandaracinus]